MARAAGARKTALIGRIDGNLKFGRKVGADIAVNSAVSDALEEAMQFTHGEGFEVVFEAVGELADTMGTALQIAKRGGTIVVMGNFAKPVELDFQLMMTKEISLLLSKSCATWKGMPEVEIAADLLARGELDAESLITHRFPLDRISDAFHVALNKNESGALKVLITY